MLIDQLVAVDASQLLFAQNHATESIGRGDSGFAAYLARVMDAGDAGATEAEVLDSSILTTDDRTGQVQDSVASQAVQAEQPAVPNENRDTSDKRLRADGETKPAGVESQGQSPNKGGNAEGSHDAQGTQRTDSSRQPKAAKNPEHGDPVKQKMPVAKRAAAAEDAGLELTGDAQANSSVDTVMIAQSKQELPPTDSGSNSSVSKSPVAEVVTRLVTSENRAVIDVVIAEDAGRTEKNKASRDERPATRDAEKSRRVQANPADQTRARQPSAADESDTAGRKKPEVVVRVNDLREHSSTRAKSGETPAANTGATNAQNVENGAVDARTTLHESAAQVVGARDVPAGPTSLRGTTGVTAGRSQMPTLATLRQTLADQVNGEVVRAARLIVRGADTGEIRLNLKPETLGNVRIMLQMQEGHIAGRIIVENSSVRDVFEQNLADLVRAFQESGMETGALDVTLGDSGSGEQAHADAGRKGAAVRQFDRAVPRIDMVDDDHELVDLVV